MREEINLPAKYIVLIVLVFISVVIGSVVFFTRNYLNNKEELSFLVGKEIKGRVVALNDENRGSYYIEIKTREETYKIHSLPIAWEIKEYNIQVGDSISKEANSKTITFYKVKNGVYEKCCDFEMW
jgi:hypothetical protein